MRTAVAVWIVFAAAHAFSAAGSAAEHPPLVGLDTTDCTTCHGYLLEGRSTIHAPAEADCTACHDVSITESGTGVVLAEEEPALCLGCHEDLAAAARGDLATPHYPATESCLTCHDPHAGAARLLRSPVHELCGSCHEPEDLAGSHGGSLPDGADCTRCHEPHGSDAPRMFVADHLHPPFAEGSCDGCHRPALGGRMRLTARGERLCAACHGDLAATEGDGASVHPALRGEKGRAGCLSCHDPHMGQRKLLHRTGPDLCASCHEAITTAARAGTGHAAAADDCLNCHLPHASEESRLLTVPADELCSGCHDTTDAELVGSHLGADLDSLRCTNCHSPHGAGHPKLLARTLHPPVLDGCDTCHEGAFDRHVEDGESALCLLCHDDIGGIAESAAVPHAAMELGSCTVCHNPHASSQDRLVRAPAGKPCLECHDAQAPERDEVLHGVIGLIGCQACHEPHGGSGAKLLRVSGSKLCLGCHNPRNHARSRSEGSVRLLDRFPVPAEVASAMATLRLSADETTGHPITGHRVLGVPTEDELERVRTVFEGELTCLTCHDPHKGRSRTLLRWGASSAMEACVHCHPR